MSLTHIRSIRRAGGKPAFVQVAIGARRVNDAPLIVGVGPTAKPASMDWTPLMGVWVIAHRFGADDVLADAVLGQLEGVGAKLLGATWDDGQADLTQAPGGKMERLLRLQRKALCTE